MPNCIETIQTRCECKASVCQPVSSYHIEAHVDCMPSGCDRMLKINITPPLNAQSKYELPYDGSMLPEDMVRQWLEDNIAQGQILQSFNVISSNKREQKFNVNN